MKAPPRNKEAANRTANIVLNRSLEHSDRGNFYIDIAKKTTQIQSKREMSAEKNSVAKNMQTIRLKKHPRY